MKRKYKITLTAISVIIIALIVIGPIMSNVEQPEYEVIHKYDHIEVRSYKPMIVAETAVTGVREDAISEGFKQLADYIFGNNIAADKIEMTAPVMQQAGQNIPMTAPVMQHNKDGAWHIHFVMPSEYKLSELPKPKNPNVTLKEIDKRDFIVITFSGSNSEDNINHYEQEIRAFMKEQKLSPQSEPIYAFYNPPWTLPPLRRNEIMFEVKVKEVGENI
ncbi:MAG: heme-binding protein [Pseudomonadota bacterium]